MSGGAGIAVGLTLGAAGTVNAIAAFDDNPTTSNVGPTKTALANGYAGMLIAGGGAADVLSKNVGRFARIGGLASAGFALWSADFSGAVQAYKDFSACMSRN